jgi:hypothetical protein
MSEIRFITSSDEHVADQNPIFRKDSYREAIFAKLVWQGEQAKRFDADAVLRGGDFWHIKAANKTTMASLVNAIGIHKAYPCPTYAVIGNHDMSNNDPGSVIRQPVGVMLHSIFNPLHDQVFTDGTMRVRVVGVDYTTDLADDGLQQQVRKRDGDTYTIAVVHALAAMAPQERIQSFFNERIFDYRDLVFEGCPDVYVFGHYHKDQGIVDHLGVKFVNLGAISRGALTFENLERQPKIASIICNSQGISIEEHIIPHADASVVFDLERKKKLENVRRGFDEFISKLQANMAMASGNEVQQRIEAFQHSTDFSSDLKVLMTEIMQAAELGDTDAIE